MDICIEKPSVILDTMHYTLARVAQTFVKDGVELEKGYGMKKGHIKVYSYSDLENEDAKPIKEKAKLIENPA